MSISKVPTVGAPPVLSARSPGREKPQIWDVDGLVLTDNSTFSWQPKKWRVSSKNIPGGMKSMGYLRNPPSKNDWSWWHTIGGTVLTSLCVQGLLQDIWKWWYWMGIWMGYNQQYDVGFSEELFCSNSSQFEQGEMMIKSDNHGIRGTPFSEEPIACGLSSQAQRRRSNLWNDAQICGYPSIREVVRQLREM